MEEDGRPAECPVCKTDQYINPQLRLLVSPCYHRLCEACVARLYGHGPAPCPICHTVLRKSNFTVPTFVDLRVEKEMRVRRALARAMARRPEDFDTVPQYDDYLEDVEDLVESLVAEPDVQKTWARLEAMRAENNGLSRRNLARDASEEEARIESLRSEEEARRQREMETARVLQEEETARQQERRAIISALATSDQPAAVIVAQKSAAALKRPSSTLQRPERADFPAGISALRTTRSGRMPPAAANVPPLDPLDTVPALRLPVELTAPMLDASNPLYDLKFDPAKMAAGGMTRQHLSRQILQAAFSWGPAIKAEP